MRLLGLRTGWVWLVDPATGRFYSAASQNLPPFLADPVRMTGRSCWCIDAFRSGRLAAGNIDVIECSRLRSALGADKTATRGLRHHASIPLAFGGRRLGIMNVATGAWRKLTRRELDLLSTVASQVSVAIERARLAESGIGLARVQERERLARDLHDTLTQGLTAIGLHVEAALPAVDAPPAREQLERALSIARSNLADARRSLRELRESPLAGRPLAEALAALGRELTSDTGVLVHLQSSVRGTLPPSLEDALFRIASEALVNVRRHAAARRVEIALAGTRRRVTLTIADDGRGFRTRAPRHGFGILGMRERAALAGGRVSITSRPGRGTRVHVTVGAA